MGIGKKITKGSMGGGVNISHKSKMSQSAKNQMSFPGGMPGPGNYGSTNNNVVGKGMAQYMAGEAVGMKKYGKHKGTAKMDPMHNGEPGVQKEDFQQFSDGPAKTRSEKRLERTKLKATQAKEDADKANDGSTGASLEKMNRTKAKAKRLAKREKRQEGRAERKKIRKDYKDQKGKRTYVDSKDNPTDEKTTTSRLVTNSSKKQKQIKASRKKQKAKDPVVKKEFSSGEGGVPKAGDMKKVKKVNEMSNRRRKDTYSYQEPKAKVLKK